MEKEKIKAGQEDKSEQIRDGENREGTEARGAVKVGEMMEGRVVQLENRLKETEGEDEEDNSTKISISNQPALKKKKSILHNRLCMREIVRRALIKESIM